MKKKVLMALLLGMCVAAAGCSAKEDNAKTTEAVSETTTSEHAEEASETDTKTTEDKASEASTEKGSEKESSAADTAKTTKTAEPDYKALDYVTLGQYKALEVTVSSPEVTEEDIQNQYYTDCESNDQLMQITEGEVADGDVTNIDYVGSVDGVEFDGGTDKGVDLTIGSGKFIDGFESGLIGAPIGEKTDINVTFPENYGEKSLAGKDAVFAVTVNFVKQVPEMTDEVVAAISDCKTADEYRSGLEKTIHDSKVSQQEYEKLNGILNLLYSGSTIKDYPQAVVDYRTAEMKDYYAQIAEQSGMDFATFLSEQLNITEEQFDEQVPNIVKESMIQEILLKAVAESEKMEITDEEYDAGVERYVASTGSDSKETLLSKYPEEEIRRYILMDKVLDFLKENTTTVVEGEKTSEGETTAETASEAETSGTETAAVTESETETAEAGVSGSESESAAE